MRFRHALVTAAVSGALAAGAFATPAQAGTSSAQGIPSYCKPGNDSNYFGVKCQTARVYYVKAVCDNPDGRHKTLTGNDAANNGWSTIHCNTLGSGWYYRPASGQLKFR
ncbi:hypothetical protein [Streptomyces sp. NPDC059788]|uniref:hypothetical protein n=1 Tax=Streptomyces sp. NPDC059788 TaxID=3346948 RepID=UPI00365CAAFE